MGEGVKEAVIQISIERRAKEGVVRTREEVEAWWESVRNERFAVDVCT